MPPLEIHVVAEGGRSGDVASDQSLSLDTASLYLNVLIERT